MRTRRRGVGSIQKEPKANRLPVELTVIVLSTRHAALCHSNRLPISNEESRKENRLNSPCPGSLPIKLIHFIYRHLLNSVILQAEAY